MRTSLRIGCIQMWVNEDRATRMLLTELDARCVPMIENQPGFAEGDRIGYLPQPSARGVPQIAPLGGWKLYMPSNLREAVQARSPRKAKPRHAKQPRSRNIGAVDF